jgi:ubiquitin-protein ligase
MDLKTKAIQRLQRDLKEWQSHPLEGIYAIPDEKDIFSWHVNLAPSEGDYRGTVFHLTMKFSDNYPKEPPQIKLPVRIPHPNVFPSFICLDMLKSYTSQIPYQGWTSAYSVHSILMQLSAFLFDANVPQEGGYTVENKTSLNSIIMCIREAKAFRCQTCKHDGASPQTCWPPICMPTLTLIQQPENKGSTIKSIIKEENKEQDSALAAFPPEIVRVVVSYLSVETMILLDQVCNYSKKAMHNLIKVHQLTCFYSREALSVTKTTNKQQTLILGFGVTPHWYSEDKTNLREVTCCWDLLSLEAFQQHHVRHGIWKSSFTYLLPLIINRDHAARAWPEIQQTLYKLIIGEPADSPPQRMENMSWPDLLPKFFNVIANAMTTMIVSFMKTVSSFDEKKGGMRPTQQLHHSEKALEGYCSLHHLLLFMREKYPALVTFSNQQIAKFVGASPTARSKKSVPNLGEFLIHLLVSDQYTWETVQPWFVCELLDRNAMWYLREQNSLDLTTFPNPKHLTAHEICFRLRVSWYYSRVGARLTMFQVFFMNLVAQTKLEHYHESFGFPEPDKIQRLQQECKKIMNVSNYGGFLSRMGIVQTPANVFGILCDSVLNSFDKGYHYHKGNYDQKQQKIPCMCADKTYSDGKYPGPGCMFSNPKFMTLQQLRSIQSYRPPPPPPQVNPQGRGRGRGAYGGRGRGGRGRGYRGYK